MLYLIGNAPDSPRYQKGTFVQFLEWEALQQIYQLDIETDVTPWWCNKRLMTVQLGSLDGKTQWVFQWSALSTDQQAALKVILENPAKQKLIHNAMFEAVVLLFHGIRLCNVYDTMLVEMVLFCGTVFKEDDDEEDESEEGAGFYALTSLTYRYLNYRMDKSEQLSFGDDILTENKVCYAAADVIPLGPIRAMQLLQLHSQDLEYVAALENEVVLAYAEMTFNGMEIDHAKWRENIGLAMPVVAQAKQELDEWLTKEPFATKARALGFYDDKDRFNINWGSPQQKGRIIEQFFPFLKDKMSKAVLGRLIKLYDKDGTCSFSDIRAMEWVRAFHDGDWAKIEAALIETDRQWLIDNEFLTPAGAVTINWNSTKQALPMFHVIQPKMAAMDAETMSKVGHPIARSLENYKDSLKLITTYGEAFLTGTEKRKGNVEPDGKVRTSFNQIVSTGRISSRRPNMQNIPAKESVGTRYRNAFVCSPGWKYVDSDFASQELVIIAYLSNDPVWNAALKEGKDLHSVCAELVFPGNGWYNAQAPGCEYYKLDGFGKPQKQKCSCKAHKTMRNAVKSINFGLAYGMSEYKLASTLKISVQEAKKLIDDYFKAFPSIGGLLTQLGRFGVTRGYIQTIAPFFRKRWFPYWKFSQSRVREHISGVKYDPTLGSIERASKNTPIQGTAGDMAKLSLLLLYYYIADHNLFDTVKLNMQVHDQNTCITTDAYAETWKPIMSDIMRKAAFFIIPNGLLDCETVISPVWTK